jgi:hypothetical protein
MHFSCDAGTAEAAAPLDITLRANGQLLREQLQMEGRRWNSCATLGMFNGDNHSILRPEISVLSRDNGMINLFSYEKSRLFTTSIFSPFVAHPHHWHDITHTLFPTPDTRLIAKTTRYATVC